MAAAMGGVMAEEGATVAGVTVAGVTVVETVEAEETQGRAAVQKGIRALVIQVPALQETPVGRLVRLEAQTPAARRVLAMLAAEIRAGRLEIRQAVSPEPEAVQVAEHKAPAET